MNTAKHVIHRSLDMHAYLTKGTEYEVFPYRGQHYSCYSCYLK